MKSIKKYGLKVLGLGAAMSTVCTPAFADGWTVDITSVMTDVTTAGTAILGVVGLIYAFRVIKGLFGGR